MDQDGLAGAQRMHVMQQQIGRDALQEERGGRRRIDVGRQRRDE